MTETELREVGEADKVVLGNLIQLYRYDLSEVRDYRLSEHGTYLYRWLDHYFIDDGRRAYFIKVDGELAGFVMVRHLIEEETWSMAEFFVVRRWRRRGVGRAAARAAFARHPGRWSIQFDDANRAADAFWTTVAAESAAGGVDRRRKPDGSTYEGVELVFDVTRSPGK